MDALAFLAGDSEMGALMRAHDWSATPLGPASLWPQPLRMVVRLLLNTRHPMFVFWGPALTCLYNDAYSASLGRERHPSALGRPAREVWAEIWGTIGPQIEQVMSGGKATWHEDHLVPITRHGRREAAYWTYSYSPIDQEAADTGVGGVLVVCTETTAQVLARQRQAQSVAERTTERDRLARLFAQAPSFIALLSGPEHRFELANQAYLSLTGHRDILGRPVAEALPEAAGQGYLDLLDGVFQSGDAFSSRAARFVVQAVPGGPKDERFVDFIYQPVRDEAGEVTGIFVEGSDVTDRVRAEMALRDHNEGLEQRVAAEAAARRKTEEALHQAQKMEVMGQLTGGIAHDFNNMLQGVMSGIKLAQRRIASGRLDDAPQFLDAALQAAHRAGALTQRLLAFGRRQVLDPRLLVVDDVVHGLLGLIRQTVGSRVEVELRLRDGCWPVRCDPNQMENALLNLAINARDAMLPGGGRLLIETEHTVLDEAEVSGWDEARPGEYVRITVSDTGTGMTPEVLAQAFEPFFTTKPDGQGTGLGLSQISGFVRQSAGVARLESKAGAGTSVHLYLARFQETSDTPRQQDASAEARTGVRP